MFSVLWFISGELWCAMYTPSHRRSHSSVGVLPLTRGRIVAGGSQAPGNSPVNKLQNVIHFFLNRLFFLFQSIRFYLVVFALFYFVSLPSRAFSKKETSQNVKSLGAH